MTTANGNTVLDEQELLDRATAFLKKEGAELHASPVQIEWARSTDEHGQRLYTLKLSDPEGEAQGTFSPEQLREPISMRHQMLRLWDGMLQSGLDKLVRKMREAREREATNGSDAN